MRSFGALDQTLLFSSMPEPCVQLPGLVQLCWCDRTRKREMVTAVRFAARWDTFPIFFVCQNHQRSFLFVVYYIFLEGTIQTDPVKEVPLAGSVRFILLYFL